MDIDLTNTIAIIPAKAESKRLPRKNVLPFLGKPLFLWSVEAALDAGITPIVSTDSDEIKNICDAYNVKWVQEKWDGDGPLERVVEQVLAVVDAHAFVLLQPTSPLRVPGLIHYGFCKLEEEGKHSAYTYKSIKPTGHFGDEFYRGQIEQECPLFFKWFDGNIIWCHTSYFKEHGTFMTAESIPIENVYPATQQIDYKREADGLEAIAKKTQYRVFVPGAVSKVAVVSNKHRYKKNYSKFIDSCDIVVRVNRMENANTGSSGNRTDVLCLSNSQAYFVYDKMTGCAAPVPDVPLVWTTLSEDEKVKPLLDIGMNGGVQVFIPGSNVDRCWTTYAAAIKSCMQSWSRCHVYAVGTFDVKTRTGDGWIYHKHSDESIALNKYLNEGRLTIVDEEDIDSKSSRKLKFSV